MIEQTLEKMRKMKLYGMLRSFKHATQTQSMAGLTADELIHLLVENEWDERQNRSMVQNPVKLTPASRSKLTPSRRVKLTPGRRSKLTPLEEYFLGME